MTEANLRVSWSDKRMLVAHRKLSALDKQNQNTASFTRIIKLLSDPHSCLLYDRHNWALKRLVKKSSGGFFLKDLPQVFKIFQICVGRVENVPIYEKPMIDLLKICSIPYRKERMSDDVVYKKLTSTLTTQLGLLLPVPRPEIQLQICETLISLYSPVIASCRSDEPKIVDTVFRKETIEMSEVAEKLVEALKLVEGNLKVRVVLLKVLINLSHDSAVICDQMLKSQCAARVCCRMLDPDSSGLLLFRSVEVLWNLLEKGNKEMIASQMRSVACIKKLRDAFLFQLNRGYSQSDLQLRNDLLVVTTLLGTICPTAPFLETGFIELLIVLATFQEEKAHCALLRRLKILRSNEDFEFKKLLFNLMVVFSQDPAVLAPLSQGRVIRAMFSFVTFSMTPNELQHWTDAQYEELQLHAMACLCTLCPLLLDDYLACEGGERLLLLLEGCASLKHDQQDDLTFHGDAAREHKRSRMKQCLRLMRSIVSTGDPRVMQDLADQGGIGLLIDVLCKAFPATLEFRDVVSIHMQTDILFILSCLCEADNHRMQLFGAAGVDTVLKYLTVGAKEMKGSFGHRNLLIVAVDLVWSSIVECTINREYFLEKEGAFLLSDLLDTCHRPMRNQILGCLLDLCSHHKTLDHILTWRGRGMITLPRLLCQLWREEETRMLTKRDEQGVLTDPSLPLMGQVQQSQGLVPQPCTYPSPAIVDISENMRGKIYALLTLLSNEFMPGLEVEDYVTLCLVEKYLDFKTGEVWTELMRELEAENVDTIHSDAEAMDIITHIIAEDAKNTLKTQKEIVQALKKYEALQEQNFYNMVLECNQQRKKTVKEFKDYVARTSKYAELKAAKYKMDLSINSSRGETGCLKGPTFHNTEIPNLQITTFCGRFVRVVDLEPKKEEVPLKTVQPDEIAVQKFEDLFMKHLGL